MTFSFHPQAESEFNEAINYYEDRELGLGYDFSIEFQRILFSEKSSYSEKSMDITRKIAPIPIVISKTHIGSADSFFSSILLIPFLIFTLLRRKPRTLSP